MIVPWRSSSLVIRWWVYLEVQCALKTTKSPYDRFIEFFVSKIDQIRSIIDPDRLISVVFSDKSLCWASACNWKLCENSTSVPKEPCKLNSIPNPVLNDCLDEINPIVTKMINKSLLSGIVPQHLKHAPAKPQRPILIQAAWNSTILCPIWHYCQRSWGIFC